MVVSEKVRSELIETIKNRETVELGEFLSDREYAGHIFFFLGMVIAADGKIKTAEVKMLTSICGKLGFPTETAKTDFSWVPNVIRLNNERKKLLVVMSVIKPVFVLKKVTLKKI